MHIRILRDKSRIMRGDAAQAMSATWWQMHQTEGNTEKKLFPKLANNQIRMQLRIVETYTFIGIYGSIKKKNIHGTFLFHKSKENCYFERCYLTGSLGNPKNGSSMASL